MLTTAHAQIGTMYRLPPSRLERIESEVEVFLSRFSSVVAAVKDTGGMGLCEFYSRSLAAWLRHRGHSAYVAWVTREQVSYPYDVAVNGDPEVDHYITVVGDVRIDLTARQFDSLAPFPMVWRTR